MVSASQILDWPRPMTNWYSESLFLLHYSHNFSPSDDPSPLSGLDREQVSRVLQRVRPDAVQYTAKGPAGYVPYATRFDNRLPYVIEDPDADLLAVYRSVTRELGIRFVVGYSGLIDMHAADWHPSWTRISSSYTP